MAQGRWRGVLRADGTQLVVWVRSGSVSDAGGLVGIGVDDDGLGAGVVADVEQHAGEGMVERLGRGVVEDDRVGEVEGRVQR